MSLNIKSIIFTTLQFDTTLKKRMKEKDFIMSLSKQKIKDIIEAKTNKDFDTWKSEKLEEHMIMLMKKDKNYKQWEDKFIEDKAVQLIIDEAEKSSKRQNNIGGNE